MLRTRREQFIKWTTEGAVKAGIVPCEYQQREHASSAGDMMVSYREHISVSLYETRWQRGVNSSLVVNRMFITKDFFMHRGA